MNFSERFEVRAMTRAEELVQGGAIGRVVQTVGFRPHRLNRHLRPDWFFRRADAGGILIDIGSHQIDQFFHFTGSESAEIVASAVANYANPGDPEFGDFGELLLRSEQANGYIRVDWYTGRVADVGRWPVHHPRHGRLRRPQRHALRELQ